MTACESWLGYTTDDDGVHLWCHEHPEYDANLGTDASIENALSEWLKHKTDTVADEVRMRVEAAVFSEPEDCDTCGCKAGESCGHWDCACWAMGGPHRRAAS